MKKIKEIKCKDCGCTEITSEKREQKHTNGFWNEYRTFKCGREIHFSPNFMSVIVEYECERSPLYTKCVENRKDALKRTRNYIKKLKVDDDFKEKLQNELRYCSPNYPSIKLKKLFPEEFV